MIYSLKYSKSCIMINESPKCLQTVTKQAILCLIGANGAAGAICNNCANGPATVRDHAELCPQQVGATSGTASSAGARAVRTG